MSTSMNKKNPSEAVKKAQRDEFGDGLSKEMARRAKLRKTVGGGFRNRPNAASAAAKTRWDKYYAAKAAQANQAVAEENSLKR